MVLWFVPAKIFSVIASILDRKTEKIKKDASLKKKKDEQEDAKENPIWTSFYQELNTLDSYLDDNQKPEFHNSMANFLDFTLYMEQEHSDNIMRLTTLVLTAANCMNGHNEAFPPMFVHFVLKETFDQISIAIEIASRSEAHKSLATYEIHNIGRMIGVVPDYKTKKGEGVWLKSQ